MFIFYLLNEIIMFCWATLHLLDGHSEERPISAQPYLGGCYRTGSE